MWVGRGLTPWFHGVPTVMTRGACQISGRVAAYKWLYLSWKRLLPLFSFTVGISASVRVRMMYAGVSDPHLPQWMMWVGNGLTPWFHGVPTVMTRGACQILGRVTGQFSHFSQVERHMAYTVVPSIFSSGRSYQTLAYKWLYLSWKQLLPLFSFTIGISASVRVRMMYAGVSDPHLPQWRMWVGRGLTPWFHGVPTVMTRGACQISGRVAGQFSHFSQVERHMAYTRVRMMSFEMGLIPNVCMRKGITSDLREGVVSVFTSDRLHQSLAYKWLYLSWKQLLPLFSFTVGISASVQVRMMYAGVSDPHLPQWRMWVGRGLTPWFHGVPTVMTRGACQILGRVAGQFSHFSQRKVRITLNNSVCTLKFSVICTLLKLAIVFVTSVIYHWNQRVSESQDQNNTWPTQEWYLFPPPTICIRDDASVRVRMMYAGVSDPHLPQWMMWVRKGLTPWSHGVPTVMTRGACQILGRVAGQFSHFSQVERHMAYTSKVRITLNISLCMLNISVICTLLKLGIVFVTSVIYHWNQRVSESQDQNNTWPTQEWSSVRTLRLSVQMALSQLEMTFTTFLFDCWNQRICLSQNDVCWGF
ncbi:hypothetical protein PROFUN_16105 [Planoprotostelium fungivorum]|uniref:Uncharacterized protein n=1 Tax=Planoprotostelium fungivorum TaxID=1890364 RepID=A0A2P6MRL2_9EUKA|nr:hypothetical protein PROFUN_16105 [Planoprotostelium fungivorum]